MKHKLAVLVSLAVIAGVGVVSAIKYENHNHWVNVQNAKAHAQAWAEQQAAKQAQAKEEKAVNALKLQCEKDHQLFVASKGKSPAGDCDPSLTIVQ